MSIFLEKTTNSVFIQKPVSVQVNAVATARYLTSRKIETLIEELKEMGPFIGVGRLGPNSYTDSPFKLNNTIHGQDLFGWKPGANRKDETANYYIMILGAKKTESHELVYFTTSDIGPSSTFKSDEKIYVVSHATFKNYLTVAFPSQKVEPQTIYLTSRPRTAPTLLPSDNEFIEKLNSIDLESILDRGEGEKGCKKIGQEIFDKYKREAGGNSFAGKEAVQRVCTGLASLRRQYVERAWDGIGDANWQWMA